MNAKEVVYFISDPEGLTKIGKTNDLERRFRNIQAMSPKVLEVRYRILVDPRDVFETERYFHKLFRGKRKHGEWFDLDDKDILFVREYATMLRSRRITGKTKDWTPIARTVSAAMTVVLVHAIIINRILSIIPPGT